MDDSSTTILDACVVAWLRDVRQFVELECSTILLAKSILPKPQITTDVEHQRHRNYSSSSNLLARTNNRHSSLWKRRAESENEIIIGGRIPVVQDVTTTSEESTSSSNDRHRCSMDNYGDFTEFNRNFEKTNSTDLPAPCNNELKLNGSKSLSHLEEKTEQEQLCPPNLHMSTKLLSHDDSSLDSACGSSPVFSSGDSPLRTSSPINEHLTKFSCTNQMDFIFLPSYANAKSSIERLLNASNRIFTSLTKISTANLSNSAEIISQIREFINMLETCSVLLIPIKEVEKTKQSLTSFETQPYFDEFQMLENCTKKLIHKVHIQLVKIVIRYLSDWRPVDKNLDDALNHLTHLALFSQQVCVEAAQCGAVSHLARILKSPISSECHRLALRSLAILCSISKGCVQLFSIGGLELIARLLHSSNIRCSIEAAGVLTQLTTPSHSFAAWPSSLSKIVVRLLELCEQCENSNSFLLCSAALANLSVQHTSVSELLYKHNAVHKFSRVYSSFAHNSIFAQDQIATVFARLSANGYERALVTQGAVPCLLLLLQCRHSQHVELAKKIRSKAAVCIGTLGSSSFGLQAIHEQGGLLVLRKTIKIETHCDQQNPVIMICNSVITNLLRKYRQESVV